jgi:hypothetical protein
MEQAKRLRRAAETLVGLLLAVTPVLLWVAWTPEILIGVMLASLLCAGLLVLLAESSRNQGGAAQRTLPPEFIDELHRLFPLTYHHSRHESPRFRRAMDKMKIFMGSPSGGRQSRH